MSTSMRDETTQNIEIKDNRSGHDRLSLLYQSFLTVAIRIQSKREKIGEPLNFRQRMKSMLDEVERSAAAQNYDFQDIQDAHLAVVAFLDEIILASDDPVSAEWRKLPLAQDALGQPVAGEVSFEKLEGMLRSRKDTQRLGDLLEVFLLCLLLGFEGKYSGDRSAELQPLMERTRSRIEGIRQQRGKSLSPDWELPEEMVQAAPAQIRGSPLGMIALCAAIGVVILFIAFELHLVWASNAAAQILTGNN